MSVVLLVEPAGDKMPKGTRQQAPQKADQKAFQHRCPLEFSVIAECLKKQKPLGFPWGSVQMQFDRVKMTVSLKVVNQHKKSPPYCGGRGSADKYE